MKVLLGKDIQTKLATEGLSMPMGLAQQRYVKSHRIFANSLGVKDFRPIRNSQDGTCFSRSVFGV
jgi:hypothetical protein